MSLSTMLAESLATALDEGDVQFDRYASVVGWRSRLICFEKEWKQFIEAVKEMTGLESVAHDDFQVALHRFLPVIMNAYSKEDGFKVFLFDALRKSLGEFCEDIETDVTHKKYARRANTRRKSNASAAASGAILNEAPMTRRGRAAAYQTLKEQLQIPIRLRGCGVGFATKVSRSESLKLPNNYGMSMGAAPDLACLVFGEDAHDATATIDLKIGNASCKEYCGGPPKLNSGHAPLAKALLHAMDVWHCLARRGLTTPHPMLIPAVVLAAKEKNGREGHLCCMECSLKIPETLGGMFQYNIDRCILFPPESSEKEEEKAAYTKALAVFIKTLRIGLTKAKVVKENKKLRTGAVSLCCSPPRGDLQLVASPIPLVKRSTHGLKIAQGELYQFLSATVSVEDWIRNIEKETCIVLDGSPVDGASCIVKVSCNTVHDSLVSSTDNWRALERIESKATPQLKAELSKIVLACAFASRKCMVTVMKMLSCWHNESQRNSCVLSFPSPFDTPLLCWEAFSKLVKCVLLPLANIGIVHTDIRFDPRKESVCNIVVDAGLPSELRMIDFESLVILNDVKKYESQDYAISLGHLRASYSPEAFVFWQVLWMAYVWCPNTAPDSLVIAWDFVDLFFSDQAEFGKFTKWIEDNSKDGLRRINNTSTKQKDSRVILDTLAIFREVFTECSVY
jgi:hypothetical protein